MKLELKTYKISKIKYYLKKNKLFFFYAASSFNLKNWLLIEQTFKQSNLNYYRLSNTLTIKTMETSIYTNYRHLIHSLILCVSSKSKTILKLKKLINLEKVLTLLGIKLNNKIYSILQLKNLNSLKYTNTVLRLFQLYVAYLTYTFRLHKKNFEIM